MLTLRKERYTPTEVPAVVADGGHRYCYSQPGFDARLRLLCDLRKMGWTEILVRVELAAAGFPAVQSFHDCRGRLLGHEEIREEPPGLRAWQLTVGDSPCERPLWTASGVPRLPVRLRTILEHDLGHREYPLAYSPEQLARYGVTEYWLLYPDGEPACEIRNTFDAEGLLVRHEELDCGPHGLQLRSVETFERPDSTTIVRRWQEFMVTPHTMTYQFDEQDRLTDMLDECEGSAPLHSRFTYSGQNAVDDVSDGSVVRLRTEYVFSASGLILQRRCPDDRGVVTSITTWLYDSHDRLVARRDDATAEFR